MREGLKLVPMGELLREEELRLKVPMEEVLKEELVKEILMIASGQRVCAGLLRCPCCIDSIVQVDRDSTLKIVFLREIVDNLTIKRNSSTIYCSILFMNFVVSLIDFRYSSFAFSENLFRKLAFL